MDTLRFRERWNAATAEAQAADMWSLARDIGFALPRIDRAKLLEFLSEFGPSVESVENRLAQAFRRTAVEIVASYETAVSGLDEERSAESLILHEGWRRILNALAKAPAGPSELAELLGVHKSQMSRALSGMRGADLVEVTPSTSAKERPHRLTGFGDRLLERLNGERALSTPSGVDAERSDITDLASRSLRELSFKTTRELTFYVALLYLAVDVVSNDPTRRITEFATLREIRRCLVDIPSGVYPESHLPATDVTQEVLALLRDRLKNVAFSADYQAALLHLGRRIHPKSNSTALAWACLAADCAAAHSHEATFNGELRLLTLAILEQHRVPLALWCRTQLMTMLDLPRLRKEMSAAPVIDADSVPRSLAVPLEDTRDVELFFSDPASDSIPLPSAPRMDLAIQLLKSARTVEAISIVESDRWFSNGYLEANCEAALAGAQIRRLVVVDPIEQFLSRPQQFRQEHEVLKRQFECGIELKVVSVASARQHASQCELENILLWNRMVMTTSRDEGRAIYDRRQVNDAFRSWERLWDIARTYAPPGVGHARPADASASM